jgi:palmitoyltransferase
MKLLTNIFRARQARQPSKGLSNPKPTQVDQGDAHMVNFLLTEFRRHIIPQTCALIFLQGQIRAGHAQPEDFPLNLWDMERMYEGVYQYLEFFAILTEHEVWKNMLSNWEVATELVTLLKELDAAIPKGQLAVPPLRNSASGASSGIDGEPQPVAVERPYDTQAGGTAPEGYMPSPRPYIDEAQDEPSDFEWRNLKKLGVLVLSSLVWKNRQVQDQIRPLGGIEAVLNCCSYDEHNPYIREHAIMCLRFLMEGNKENQDRIRELERLEKGKEVPPPGHPMAAERGDVAEEGLSQTESNNSSNSYTSQPPTQYQPPVNVKVPDEVLDQQGYETYMDSKGQVLLRKREVKVSNSLPPRSLPHNTEGFSNIGNPNTVIGGKGKQRMETRDPKDLELLVQQVMRELPQVRGVRHEKEEEKVLAKLDRGFDGAVQ